VRAACRQRAPPGGSRPALRIGVRAVAATAVRPIPPATKVIAAAGENACSRNPASREPSGVTPQAIGPLTPR
jgi:hypothetical protein